MPNATPIRAQRKNSHTKAIGGATAPGEDSVRSGSISKEKKTTLLEERKTGRQLKIMRRELSSSWPVNKAVPDGGGRTTRHPRHSRVSGLQQEKIETWLNSRTKWSSYPIEHHDLKAEKRLYG